MILGEGIKLQYEGRRTFTKATFADYPRGLHNGGTMPMLQSERCCVFDHILGSLRGLPFAIERRHPFSDDVWFELRLLRWEKMGKHGAGMETCIRLVPFMFPTQFTIRTAPGEQLAGVADPLGSEGFVYEPEFTYLRLEVWYNRFGAEAKAPLRLRRGHNVRWYNGQPWSTPDLYVCAA